MLLFVCNDPVDNFPDNVHCTLCWALRLFRTDRLALLIFQRQESHAQLSRESFESSAMFWASNSVSKTSISLSISKYSFTGTFPYSWVTHSKALRSPSLPSSYVLIAITKGLIAASVYCRFRVLSLARNYLLHTVQQHNIHTFEQLLQLITRWQQRGGQQRGNTFKQWLQLITRRQQRGEATFTTIHHVTRCFTDTFVLILSLWYFRSDRLQWARLQTYLSCQCPIIESWTGLTCPRYQTESMTTFQQQDDQWFDECRRFFQLS